MMLIDSIKFKSCHMHDVQKIVIAFELHAVTDIIDCFKKGVSPNGTVHGKPLIYELINMYTRGPAFKECIKAFVDHGLIFEDKILLSVLLDDAASLDTLLAKDKSAITKKYTFNCTFTPLYRGVSPAHLCRIQPCFRGAGTGKIWCRCECRCRS